MNFHRAKIAPLLKGHVKLTIRPVRTDECPYQWGHSYAVKTSNQGAEIARVKVNTTRQQLLHQVTDDQALEAGYQDRNDLFDFWRTHHGEGPGTSERVVIEVPVWMIWFELDLERQPEFLRPGPRGGYTKNAAEAMRDGSMVEWCPPKEFVDQKARDARRNDRERARQEADEAVEKWRKRLVYLRTLAADEDGLDVRSEMRMLERKIAQKIRKRAA